MDKMSLQREKLARSLTEQLKGVEAATCVFLIKPVLKKACPGNVPAPLMTPFHKPPSHHCAVTIPSACPQGESKPKVKVVRIVRPVGTADGQHPRHQKMKLIETLLKQRRVQDSGAHCLAESAVAGGTPPVHLRQKQELVIKWTVDAPYICPSGLSNLSSPKYIVQLIQKASTRKMLLITTQSNVVQSPSLCICPPIL